MKSLDIYQTDGAALKFSQGSKISVTPAESERPTVIDEARVFAKITP